MLASMNNILVLDYTRLLYFPRFPVYQTKNFVIKNIFRCGFSKLNSSIMNSFSTFGLYRNLETVLNELNDSKHHGIKAVQELLSVFNNAKQKFDEQNEVKKYPLIILEGLDGSGKSAMTRRLASKIQAEKWLTPPESIKFLREFFDDQLTLRTAYYSLGNYIAALELGCILSHKPVIMDRFWHSTMAYAMAQKVSDSHNKLSLPQTEDNIYDWPSDLLKPDIILLLTVSEEQRIERHSRRSAASVTAQEKLLKNDAKFREDVLKAYTSMRNPGVVLVDSNGSIPRTLHLLMEKVKPLLN